MLYCEASCENLKMGKTANSNHASDHFGLFIIIGIIGYAPRLLFCKRAPDDNEFDSNGCLIKTATKYRCPKSNSIISCSIIEEFVTPAVRVNVKSSHVVRRFAVKVSECFRIVSDSTQILIEIFEKSSFEQNGACLLNIERAAFL